MKSLVKEGVEVVFGLPGLQLYGIFAALRDEPAIRTITTRHEQATTYMADGYARATGKPGVALVVPGVGLYNAAASLATAYARCSPVLVIAGQIPRDQIGKGLGGVHEIADQPSVVRNLRNRPAQSGLGGKPRRRSGAVGMRAEDPTDLGELIPLALETPDPVIIDVPVKNMPLPRPKAFQHVASLAWAVPEKV